MRVMKKNTKAWSMKMRLALLALAAQRLQVGLLREMVHRMIHFKSRQRHSLRILQKL